MANSGIKILGGLIVGTAIGAVVGLLTAPESGKKTRKKLDKEAKRLSDDLGNTVNEAISSLKTSYQEILDNATTKSKKHLEDANETLSINDKA